MMDLKDKIKSLTRDILDEVLAIRRHLHQNPELSFQEFETAQDILDNSEKRELMSISTRTTVAQAVEIMSSNGISQLVVMEGEDVAGSLTDDMLLKALVEKPESKQLSVREIMGWKV